MDSTERLTRIPSNQATRLLRWFAGLPQVEQIEAMKLSNDLFYQLRKSYKDVHRAELQLAALILALDKMRRTRDTGTSHKQPDHDLDAIGKATRIQIEHYLSARRERTKKPARKQRRVLELWPEIKLIREKGGSWRAVSDYLATKHKIRIDHSYLCRLCREFEQEQEQEQ